MSLSHIAWAMDQSLGDPLAKLLLICLADRANKETGQCWPSLARLCKDTDMSHASVARKLLMLEELGLIKRDQRDNTSTLYTMSPTETSLSPTETPPCLPERHKPVSNNLEDKPTTNILLSTFEDFWEVYPKKIGKGQARAAYNGAMKKVTPDELIAALKRYVAYSAPKEKQFTPNPATWLNGERWGDEDLNTSSSASLAPYSPARQPYQPNTHELIAGRIRRGESFDGSWLREPRRSELLSKTDITEAELSRYQ